MNSNIIFSSCQPDHIYFTWQLEIQFLNFLELGIELSRYHVLVAYRDGKISKHFQDLCERYPQVRFHFYEDTRKDKSYIPTIKPHLMSKFYATNPDVTKLVNVYIDSDVIFRELPDFDKFCNDDIIYMSNTNSYINADYIDSKGSNILDRMCDIVGVTREQVEEINQHSGGAQYILKGLDSDFWTRVENNCTPLYNFMKSPLTTNFYANESGDPTNYHPIQAWCSEMWCTLWEFLRSNRGVQVDSELNFCFGTSPIEEYNNCKILHNAGVTEKDSSKMFYKGAFVSGLPEGLDLSYVSEQYASYYYASYVKKLLELRKKH